jgi:mRNA-degrading endonuclease RelE of RelBE toxin-antitoxin system
MNIRVRVQWTQTALKTLRKLPKKVQRGLLEKADELTQGDPRDAHKPLSGPLQGCYRITYGRYRAIYRIDEQRKAGGSLLHLKVLFIVAGIRKEHDKNDIYRIAEKLMRFLSDDDAGNPPGV